MPQCSSFGQDRRLPNKAAFGRVFNKARRSRDRLFTILYRSNDTSGARLGMAIAKKNCPKAVARNRLKRIIRESFRQHQAALSGLDIVIMNRPGAEKMNNNELFESLAVHWKNCQASSQQGQDKH